MGGNAVITISLCMIVKDEEDVLARCLDSVAGLVDEIIIADTGSTDATKTIAARYTESIYDFAWIDDFAAARNFALDHATMDYVLWLDADDVLLEEDRRAFAALKRELDPTVDLVMMPYHIAFDAAGRPTYSYYRERLFRRAGGFRWSDPVHECIVPAGHIQYADIAVTHRKVHPTAPGRNLRIYERLLAQGRPLTPRQQFYYARELYYNEQYEPAAEAFRAFLDGGQGWVENNISACEDLAACYDRLGRPAEALAALTRSFAYDAPRAEICCAIGRQFLNRENPAVAAFWYELARTRRPDGRDGGFHRPECADFLPSIQLCVCYDRLGDHVRAKACNDQALACRPGDPAAQHNQRYFASIGLA